MERDTKNRHGAPFKKRKPPLKMTIFSDRASLDAGTTTLPNISHRHESQTISARYTDALPALEKRPSEMTDAEITRLNEESKWTKLGKEEYLAQRERFQTV